MHPLHTDGVVLRGVARDVRELSIDYDAPQEVFFVAESFEQMVELAAELQAMA